MFESRYLSKEEFEKIQMDTVKRYIDLKQESTALHAKLAAWSKLFEKATRAVTESMVIEPRFDFLSLPEPSEVAATHAKYLDVIAEVNELRKSLIGMGLNLS